MNAEPKKPVKPTKPIEPTRERIEHREKEYDYETSLSRILEDIPDSINHNSVMISCGGYDEDKYVEVSYPVVVIDEKYDQKKVKYDIEMHAYEEKMHAYLTTMEQYKKTSLFGRNTIASRKSLA